MELQRLINNAHDNATKKGFWELERKVIEKLNKTHGQFTLEEIKAVENAFTACRLMLIVSEAGEALEALRKDDVENFDEEIADIQIRLADFCAGEEIDLVKEVEKKMAKNANRAYKHGKNF